MLMGLKVTLENGQIISVVPLSGQSPAEALAQALQKRNNPAVRAVLEQHYDPHISTRFFYKPWQLNQGPQVGGNT